MNPCTAPSPFLGRSKAVAQVLEVVEKAARVDVPVLLTGETGTGKSHVARLLHARSPRRSGPFVTVNCAGFPDGLFESEFFGHCKGAFTGAVDSRAGLFEQSTGGTLFLDEVGELPLAQQAKLLTVVEERRVRPVGGSRPRAVDARIVAATSRVITAEVAMGSFRPDLYHRIALIRCELPPLRTRPEDLALLTAHLLDGFAKKYRRPGLALGEAAWRRIAEHSWPGNVRELAHVLEAAVILSTDPTISEAQIDPMLTATFGAATLGDAAASTAETADAADRFANPTPNETRRYSFFGSDEDEREAIRAALVRSRGNRTRAAQELGMARNTLAEKLRRHGLDV
jgi:DNA-binding NtrC family response regulator